MYEFIKIDEDTTKLKYKDKEYEIKKTVGLLEKLQSLNSNAKFALMKALKERGETAEDYIVTKLEGNKTVVDKSNLIELEHYYVGLESQKVFDDICKEICNMSLAELLVDIGLNVSEPKVLETFMKDFTLAVTMANGKSPSQEE